MQEFTSVGRSRNGVPVCDVSAIVCLAGCVRVTSPLSQRVQSARLGGGFSGSRTPALSLVCTLPAQTCSCNYPNYSARGFKLTLYNWKWGEAFAHSFSQYFSLFKSHGLLSSVSSRIIPVDYSVTAQNFDLISILTDTQQLDLIPWMLMFYSARLITRQLLPVCLLSISNCPVFPTVWRCSVFFPFEDICVHYRHK